MKRIYTILMRSVQSFGADGCSTHAAAIAYYTVFALLPMALVGVSVLGFFVGGEQARLEVIKTFNTAVALSPEGEESVERLLRGVNRARGWLGAAGLLVALWSATSLFAAIRRALDAVWHVEQQVPTLRAKLRDFVMYAGFVGLLTTATLSSTYFNDLIAWSTRAFGAFALICVVIIGLAAETIPFCAFLFLHRFGTDANVRWRDVWPAALVTTLFFEFARNAFAAYVRSLESFNVLAGSLGAAILLLLFVNYSARVALFSAELAKHRKLVRAGLLPPTNAPMPDEKQTLLIRFRDAVIRLWAIEGGAAAPRAQDDPGKAKPG